MQRHKLNGLVLAMALVLAISPIVYSETQQNVVSACHNNKAEAKHGSIEGIVNIGPFCPVERPGEPCPIPSGAYQRILIIASLSTGKRIMETHPDETGQYRFSLPPGCYIITVDHPYMPSSPSEFGPFVLQSGEVLHLDIDIDTGIR
jgi:hypothetical protein